MANLMVLEMIMPPPPPLTITDTTPPSSDDEDSQAEFKDCISTSDRSDSESMSPTPVNDIQEIKIRPASTECDKDEQNAIQKLLAESTAAFAKLNSHTVTAAAADGQNQEDEQQQNDRVSTPQMATATADDEINAQQRQQPRPSLFPGVSPLLPSLFLSSAAAARVNILEHLNISLVINLAPELIVDTPLPNPKPIYLRIPVLDKGNVDLKQFFDETADLMEDVRQSGGRTLVHCVAGVSRSAAICIAYLMKYQKMSLKDAYKHVKWERPQIRPNCGFFRQLMAYEVELTGVQTVQMVFVESIGQEVPDVYEPEYKAMEQFYQRHRHRHVRRRD